jgi:glutathione synthase/RimK-type ligase-like ATP-grasp enzyme
MESCSKSVWIFGHPEFDDYIPKINNLNISGIVVVIGDAEQTNDIANSKYIPVTVKQNMLAYPDVKDSFDICNNKGRFQKFMESDAELTYYIPKRKPKLSRKSGLTFPCVMKATESCAGKDVHIVNSRIEYKRIENKFKGRKFIIQELINYDIYWTGHFFVYHGEIKFEIYYKAFNTLENFIKCGKITNYVRELHSKFRYIFDKIFVKLNYTGVACIDFCLDSVSNDCKIFEINPRFGGSIVHNDEDFKEILLCMHKFL